MVRDMLSHDSSIHRDHYIFLDSQVETVNLRCEELDYYAYKQEHLRFGKDQAKSQAEAYD